MSLEPEEVRRRVNEWIAARPTAPNPDDFVAVLPNEILGPFPTDSDAAQSAFEKARDQQAHIVALADVNKEHRTEVLRSPIIDKGLAR
jgi:hypothetical protein